MFVEGKSVVREVEEIVDLIVTRQEPLHLSRRFEPFHDPLTSPCRQMGVILPVIQSLVLAVFNLQPYVLARRAIGSELVYDHADASETCEVLITGVYDHFWPRGHSWENNLT